MAWYDRIRFAARPGPSKQAGRSGTVNLTGYIQDDDFNSNLGWPTSIETYEEMRRSDATVRNSIALVQTPVRAAKRVIEPADANDRECVEIAAFVEEVLLGGDYLSGGFDEWLRQALDYPVYGHQVFERVAALREVRFDYAFGETDRTTTVEREAFVVANLAVRMPLTLRRWIPSDRDPSELVAVEQFLGDGRDPSTVLLPADRLVVLTHERQGDDWRGISLLRTAYKSWKFKAKLENLEAIAAERSTGLPVIYPPEGANDAQLDGAEETLRKIRQGETVYVIMPGPKQGSGVGPEQGWLIEELSVSSTGGDGANLLDTAINRHDAELMRNVLADFMRLGHENVGARATADVQQDPYYQAVEAYASYIEAVINEQIIRPLVDWNYETERYPSFRFEDIRARNLEALGTFVQSMLGQKAITADPDLERWLRSLVEAPEIVDPPDADERKAAAAPPTLPPSSGSSASTSGGKPTNPAEGGKAEEVEEEKMTAEPAEWEADPEGTLRSEVRSIFDDAIGSSIAGMEAMSAEEIFARRGYYGDDRSERDVLGRFKPGTFREPTGDMNEALRKAVHEGSIEGGKQENVKRARARVGAEAMETFGEEADRLLDGWDPKASNEEIDADNTQHAYGEVEGDKWTITDKRRSKLDADLTAVSFEGITPVNPRRDGRKPKAVYIIGGGGSGKSKIREQTSLEDANFVNIDVDANGKEPLAEYRKGVAAKRPDAAGRVHEESSTIAKRQLNIARRRDYDYVLDKVGGSGSWFRDVRKQLAAGTHDAEIHLAASPLEVARAYAERRAKGKGRPGSGRPLDKDVQEEGHRRVLDTYDQLEELTAEFDVPVTVWDTAIRPNEILAVIEGGSTKIVGGKEASYERWRHQFD